MTQLPPAIARALVPFAPPQSSVHADAAPHRFAVGDATGAPGPSDAADLATVRRLAERHAHVGPHRPDVIRWTVILAAIDAPPTTFDADCEKLLAFITGRTA